MEGKAKNKTAIQILLEKIDTLEKFTSNISLDYSKNENYFNGYRNALNAVRKIINESELLEKEKQQIMEAYKAGVSGVHLAEDYYNEKYGNP